MYHLKRKYIIIIPFLVGINVSGVAGSEPVLLEDVSILLGGDVPLLEVDVTLSRGDFTALVEGVACSISRAQEKVLH